ncbi:hypothetical protein GCM10011492_15020 [Flexivirga endophytica]|uniref:DUF6891 domain-containing protein n=1 Tax=Flexivirga endophytica TaxID=1849103 RepID=A0A916T2L8_9MICO|nr:hypothetical protein [Flexivirga endophytica]GGB25867.1 hypothetical protein GCM10011492_15020 [Flexivirga endophytica]GHB54438.1 hypothetical protein GCM10008112_24340 [Flexivirga endophytica]
MFGRRKKKAPQQPMQQVDDGGWDFDRLTPQERDDRAGHWPEEVDEALRFARDVVSSGFHDQAGVREALRDTYDTLAPDRVSVDAIADQAWSERLAEQATWSGPGDHDKVAGVFASLADRGIVARMNFACCQHCGHGEIRDEVDDPSAWRGYTFFHAQDAEGLGDEPARLWLAFGAFDRSDATELAVATDVAEELRAAGLRVEWDGTTSARIQIVDLHWRKPLPTA